MSASPSSRRSLLFAAAVFGACGVLWCWRLGTAASLDYDEGVYLVSARLLLHGHPLFAEVFSSQPPLFLDLLHGAFRVFGDSVLTGRGLMVISAAVACALTGYLAWRRIDARAAPWAMLLCGSSILFLRGARSVSADLPSVALALCALALVAGRGSTIGPARRVAAGALMGLALATKLLVAPCVVPVLAAAVEWRRARVVDALRAAAEVAIPMLAVVALASAPHGLALVFQQSVGFHLSHRARGAGFASQWSVLLARETAAVIAAGVGLAVLWWHRPATAGWLVVWLASATAFLVLHHPVFGHHFVLLLPPMAIAAGGLVLSRWPAPAIAGALLVAGLLKLDGESRFPVPPWTWSAVVAQRPGPEEAAAVAELQARIGPGQRVVTDSQWIAFVAGRDVPPSLCDTSNKRIASGSLTPEHVREELAGARAVLLWTGRLEQLPGLVDEVRRRSAPPLPFRPSPDGATRSLFVLHAAEPEAGGPGPLPAAAR